MVTVMVTHPSCTFGKEGEHVEMSEGLAEQYAKRGVVEIVETKQPKPKEKPKAK